MKRTTKGTAVIVTMINPATMETSTSTINTAFSNTEKAKTDVQNQMLKALKNNSLNGLVPIAYDAKECDGKSYELNDDIFFQYAHDTEKKDDFYKSFVVYECNVHYVSILSNMTFNKTVWIPEKGNVYCTADIDYLKHYVYNRVFTGKKTEVRKYMNMEKFIELSNKYSK